MKNKKAVYIAGSAIVIIMAVIVSILLKSVIKDNSTDQNDLIVNDNGADQVNAASDETTETESGAVMDEEYMQLSTWKKGKGTELLKTNEVFLFGNYGNDEYRTMIEAANYGISSAGEYVILEYYEPDKGMLGYIVRIREVPDE